MGHGSWGVLLCCCCLVGISADSNVEQSVEQEHDELLLQLSQRQAALASLERQLKNSHLDQKTAHVLAPERAVGLTALAQAGDEQAGDEQAGDEQAQEQPFDASNSSNASNASNNTWVDRVYNEWMSRISLPDVLPKYYPEAKLAPKSGMQNLDDPSVIRDPTNVRIYSKYDKYPAGWNDPAPAGYAVPSPRFWNETSEPTVWHDSKWEQAPPMNTWFKPHIAENAMEACGNHCTHSCLKLCAQKFDFDSTNATGLIGSDACNQRCHAKCFNRCMDEEKQGAGQSKVIGPATSPAPSGRQHSTGATATRRH